MANHSACGEAFIAKAYCFPLVEHAFTRETPFRKAVPGSGLGEPVCIHRIDALASTR